MLAGWVGAVLTHCGWLGGVIWTGEDLACYLWSRGECCLLGRFLSVVGRCCGGEGSVVDILILSVRRRCH